MIFVCAVNDKGKKARGLSFLASTPVVDNEAIIFERTRSWSNRFNESTRNLISNILLVICVKIVIIRRIETFHGKIGTCVSYSNNFDELMFDTVHFFEKLS